MARSSSKKPGEPKCRGSRAPVEGRDWVRVGGSKWLREVAEQRGKFIPLEYRPENAGRRKAAQAAAAPAPAPVEAPPEVEAEAPAEEAAAEEATAAAEA